MRTYVRTDPSTPPSTVRVVDRTIAHLDMDAFYASVELLRQPELRGKPVVVCGSGPRAVVTTASYEARKLAGIHSAMPAAVARRRLPDAVYLPPDFPAYRDASDKVMAILRQEAETVEVVGMDEAYVDLTGLFSPKAVMRRIQSRISLELGLSCSVGIADSRMLAKITSELGKPAGLVKLNREQALVRFADHSPGLVPGIGPKTVERLEMMGVRTLAELRARKVEDLSARFGPRTGPWLHRRACFRDETSLTTKRVRKSQSVETTFDTDIRDHEELARVIDRLSGNLARRLAPKKVRGRNIAIKVRLDDWTTVTRARTIPEPTNDAEVISATALELFAEYSPPRPVRLLGVRVAAFAEREEAEDAPAAATEPDDESQLDLGLGADAA